MKKFNSIIGYVNGLLPTFSRDSVISDIQQIRKEMKEVTLPMLKIHPTLGQDNPTIKYLTKKINTGHRGTLIEGLAFITEARIADFDTLIDQFEEIFEKDISSSGIDFYRVNMLYTLGLYRFWNEYLRKLLLVVVGSKIQSDATVIDRGYSAFVSEKNNTEAFIQITDIVKLSFKDLNKTLQSAKNISFNSESPTFDATARRADSAKLGFVPVAINPVYQMGRVINSVISWRYDMIAQEKQLLEMEVLYLQREANEASGESLQEIEDQISHMKNTIARLNAKIEDSHDG